MAPCTANYQLRQREPRDNFLRTDFNQDLARINAAWRGFQGGFSAHALVGYFSLHGAGAVYQITVMETVFLIGDGGIRLNASETPYIYHALI